MVRGDTRHYEHVADRCAEGLMRVALDYRLPVLNGVLAVERFEDAEARAGGSHGNKGEEAALAAIEMAQPAGASCHEPHRRKDGIDPVARSRARRRALQAVYAWQMSGGTAQQVIAQFAHEQAHEVADLEYFEDLVRGVVKHAPNSTARSRRSSTATSSRSTRSSAPRCASPPTNCAIAPTCRTAW